MIPKAKKAVLAAYLVNAEFGAWLCEHEKEYPEWLDSDGRHLPRIFGVDTVYVPSMDAPGLPNIYPVWLFV